MILKNHVALIKNTVKEIQRSADGDWFTLAPLSPETQNERLFVINDWADNLDVSKMVYDMYEARCLHNDIPVDFSELVYGKFCGVGCIFNIHDLMLVEENGKPVYWEG